MRTVASLGKLKRCYTSFEKRKTASHCLRSHLRFDSHKTADSVIGSAHLTLSLLSDAREAPTWNEDDCFTGSVPEKQYLRSTRLACLRERNGS